MHESYLKMPLSPNHYFLKTTISELSSNRVGLTLSFRCMKTAKKTINTPQNSHIKQNSNVSQTSMYNFFCVCDLWAHEKKVYIHKHQKLSQYKLLPKSLFQKILTIFQRWLASALPGLMIFINYCQHFNYCVKP